MGVHKKKRNLREDRATKKDKFGNHHCQKFRINKIFMKVVFSIRNRVVIFRINSIRKIAFGSKLFRS